MDMLNKASARYLTAALDKGNEKDMRITVCIFSTQKLGKILFYFSVSILFLIFASKSKRCICKLNLLSIIKYYLLRYVLK